MTADKPAIHVKTWDEWMPALKLDMPATAFRKLPRNPAYKYEYADGQARLAPRPRHFHAILPFADFRPTQAPALNGNRFQVRLTESADEPLFPAIFAEAFRNVQPFGGLSDEDRRQAACESLAKSREGRDGPLIQEACFTAVHGEQETAVGGIMITRVQGGDPSDYDSYTWPDLPLPGEIGKPHLTWVFVAPILKGAGIGSALLAASMEALARLGHTELWSTFLLGNDSSMLWHWRNGFRLAPYEFSRRSQPKET